MAEQPDQNAIVLQFLERRGYAKAAAALQAEISGASTSGSSSKALTADEYAQRNAPSQSQNTAQSSTNKKDSDSVAKWRAMNEPTIYEAGYKSLRTFIQGSLEMHRNELARLLWPVFVHVYLDLIAAGGSFKVAAESIMQTYSPDYEHEHQALLQKFRALKLPEHIDESEEATKWRTEKYMLTLSERGWGLLQSWLIGGSLSFHDPSASAKTGDRGRDKILSLINEHIDLNTTPGLPTKSSAATNQVGLQSDLLLKTAPETYAPFQQVKLGQQPRDPKLEKEVNRVLAEASEEALPPQRPEPGLLPPFREEAPPLPASFRIADVKREVEKIREARKRIRLGPEAYAGPEVMLASHHEMPKDARFSAAKPSVCLFTLHDTVDTMTSSAISDDCSILAAGFSESYIRLWNLKGIPFQPMSSDFDPDDVRKAAQLKKLKNKDATSTTIKLIGHSGPVYAVSFDPLAGPSDPPRYLLSSSQDGTVRLWSLETLTNIVVYRGHRDPVWDVEWSPKGVYFATASRDRTARIWCTDRTAPLRILAGHLSDVDCVRFHPNSLYVVTGSNDRSCRLWDIQKGTCVRVFANGHASGVSCVAFSHDGRYLASGGDDASVNLWDISSGKCIKSMRGHTSRIQSLAFSQESTLLISGSADETVRIWDVLSRPAQSSSNAAASMRNLGISTNSNTATVGNGLSLSMSTGGGAIVSSSDGRTSATLGIVPKSAAEALAGNEDKNQMQSPDLLGVLLTKRTPLCAVKFTEANLAIAIGAIRSD